MRLCTSFYINEFTSPKIREQLTDATKKWGGKSVYHCKYCGRLSYSSAGKSVVIPRVVLPRKNEYPSKDDFLKQLVSEENIDPADLNELLKLVPGKTLLNDVIEEIGQPFALHTLETGDLLFYRSNDPQNPHTILFDKLYDLVKLVAIHNDYESFDLNNLGNAYGEKEYVTRMDGYEFWMYETYGVATVTESHSEEAIVYAQFFDKQIDMNGYMEMNCFFEETFMS